MRTSTRRSLMPPVISRRMLDDVWRLVFEQLLAESGSPGTIAQLLLVCKAWKACGSSLLYRHLRFSGTAQLKAFYEHLFFHANDGRYPGLSTHTLTIHPPAEGALALELSSHVPRVLGYLHHLRTFEAPDLDICSSILEPLAVVAQRTLRELSLTLCSSESDGAINLALVSRFTGLKKLKVKVNWGADSTVFAIGRAPGFRMPSLTSLCWSSPRVAPVAEFLLFLTRCDLPALTSLDLNLPFLTAEGTVALKPVFKKLGPQLRHLSYDAPDIAGLPEVVFPLVPNLQQLEVTGCAPSSEFIRTLPDTAEQINLTVDYTFHGSTITLLTFMEEWLVQNPSGTGLRRIQLMMQEPQRFNWHSVCSIAPTFAGQLITACIQLAGRGVHVLDGYGKTVLMVPYSRVHLYDH
ncbi:hypothetical protein CALCODRAFT_501997 [Calocera cornea HHB12733]|uniref:F-box domain-containing protein n=1 Tax=Calocera cornea HHB12733 TaxID=1353952 RepID=A0A165DET3_9BASI|nr:hypothetical protein CALCODRAFT_501997 [Calocera cornea HHB12733]